MTKANGSASPLALPTLADLAASRTDYEDVPVPQLGGRLLRLWGISGETRVTLMLEARKLLAETGVESEADVSKLGEDAKTIADVLRFQSHVVAASLGYPEEMWEDVAKTLPSDAIDDVLYPVAERLSALNPTRRAKAVEEMGTTASAGSGTG